MATVPPLVCETLGLAHGTSIADLIIHRATSYDYLDGLISSDDARATAQVELANRDAYEVHLFRQAGTFQERFCSVEMDGLAAPIRVGLLSAEPAQYLPTDLENLVLWALLSPGNPWHAQWKNDNGRPVSDWRRVGSSHAVVATPVGTEPQALRVLSGLFDLEHPDFPQAVRAPSLARQATAVRIHRPPSAISPIQIRLLREAATVAYPKWRCLSLYRILENAYLTNIKQTLVAEFDVDAGRALDVAKKKVSSEVMQLVSLAEDADLGGEFLRFNLEVDALIAANNQFITKLDKGAEADPLYGSQELFKKGVLRFYKLRCAIAHAGTSSVIYEQFSDADAAATALLPSIEAIALKSLKILI
jgi:hypothetical protein